VSRSHIPKWREWRAAFTCQERDSRRRRHGVRWQAKRDTALSWILLRGPMKPAIFARPKAPSPLRSAGALHKVLTVPAHARNLLMREVDYVQATTHPELLPLRLSLDFIQISSVETD
jgi:hypothetical protein